MLDRLRLIVRAYRVAAEAAGLTGGHRTDVRSLEAAHEAARCGLRNVLSIDGQGGRAARTRCPSGALTVGEMQRLIEAEFARLEPRPASRPGLLPLGQLELARQRLMESLPRLVALTGRSVAAAFEAQPSRAAAV